MATFTIGNFDGLTFADGGLVSQSLEAYGMSGTLTSVSVSLGGLRHTYSDDLDMVLSSPDQGNGATDNFLFWSDVGGMGDLFNAALTIADSGAAALADSSAPSIGTFRPADYIIEEFASDFDINGNATFGRAAPGGGGTFSSVFGGDRPNGAWTLRVRDDASLDIGSLDIWSLAIETNGRVDIDGTAGADTIHVNLTGFGTGTYQMNALPVIGFAGVGSTSFDLSGGGGADTILASGQSENITGGTARDTIRAGGGIDFITIAVGEDVAGETYDGGAGRDTILFGGFGSQTLNLRDDTLASIEALDFGSGTGSADATDIVRLRAAQIGPGIAANATINGTVTIPDLGPIANASDRLDIVMETATSLDLSGLILFGFSDPGDFVMVTGDGNSETIRGSSVADRIYGNGGNDTLDGGTGADRLDGGTGNDTYVTNGGDVISETSAAGGTDTVKSSATLTLGANLENLTLTGAGAINGTGNGLNNVITGNGAANTLNGLTGTDRLIGGLGDDTYVTDGGDVLSETSAAGGTDTVKSSATLTLGANLENLTLTGASSVTGTGNGLANTLTGNSGNNVLDGLGGGDRMLGSSGSDTFAFSTALGGGNVDIIADFSSAADTIRLDKSVFAALGLGALAASAYKDIGDPGAVVDADDRILYDDDTGALFYDANGSGSGSRVQFATLENKPPTLVPADFLVVA